MQTLKCTGKLRKEMGIKEGDLSKDTPEASPLGSWHANLIYIDRKKHVLFVNDKTLFNFIVADLSRAKIRDLAAIFVRNLTNILALEGFPEKMINEAMQEYKSIQYAKTNSKSILGSMNDLSFHYKYNIQYEDKGALPNIIRNLNRMPMGAIGYAFPVEELKKVFEGATK